MRALWRSALIALPLFAFDRNGAPGPSPAVERVTIHFRAIVGAEPFACGRTYDGIGATRAHVTPHALSLYVHDVRLVATDGHTVPIALDDDSTWQGQGVALLNFTEGPGICANSTVGIHDIVQGTVASGQYVGIAFTLGVPFPLNHTDLTTAHAPLDLTRMFWSWNAGHKFLRLDLTTSKAQPWFMHLGSTGCTPDQPAVRPPVSCANANLATVQLDGFDPDKSVVVLDVAALLAHANVEHNQPHTAPGCMSDPLDTDCAPVFESLGLPFGAHAATPQTAFRIARP